MEVIRTMSEFEDGARDAAPEDQADWREEFKCAKCRAWTATPPLRFEDVRRALHEAAPELTEYRLSHACYLCHDADGRPQHVPTTIFEGYGRFYQWFPQLPEGHRPYGAKASGS